MILATAISASIVVPRLNRQQSLPAISPGLILTYYLTTEGNIQLPNITHGFPTNPAAYDYKFYFDIRGNYPEVLAQMAKDNGTALVEPSSDCQVMAKSAVLRVVVLSVRINSDTASITLNLKTGEALCGPNYGQLPNSDSGWSPYNGLYFTSFDSLSVTDQVVISILNGDTTNTSGYPLGQWVFWLTRSELSQNCSLLLYNLVDDVSSSLPAQGEANVLPINASESSLNPFNVKGYSLNRQDQVYVDRTMLPSATVILNVPFAAGETFVSEQESLYRSYSDSGECPPAFCSIAFVPAGLLTDTYANGSIYVGNDSVLNDPNLTFDTPFQFNPHLFVANGSANVLGQEYHMLEYFPGIIYHGTKYFTVGFEAFAELESALFSRNGLLLGIKIAGEGELFPALPSVVDRLFGLTILSGHIGDKISLVLAGIEHS